jgi:hypothetical protein
MILWEEIAPKSRLSSAFSCFDEEFTTRLLAERGAALPARRFLSGN